MNRWVIKLVIMLLCPQYVLAIVANPVGTWSGESTSSRFLCDDQPCKGQIIDLNFTSQCQTNTTIEGDLVLTIDGDELTSVDEAIGTYTFNPENGNLSATYSGTVHKENEDPVSYLLLINLSVNNNSAIGSYTINFNDSLPQDNGTWFLTRRGIIGDVDKDRIVTICDMHELAYQWLRDDCDCDSGSNAWCRGTDLNFSGAVDTGDYAVYIKNWRKKKIPGSADLTGLPTNPVVNTADLAAFAKQWLRDDCNCANKWCSKADLDFSGTVDIIDYAHFAAQWEAQ